MNGAGKGRRPRRARSCAPRSTDACAAPRRRARFVRGDSQLRSPRRSKYTGIPILSHLWCVKLYASLMAGSSGYTNSSRKRGVGPSSVSTKSSWLFLRHSRLARIMTIAFS